jgi:hypothetical protein
MPDTLPLLKKVASKRVKKWRQKGLKNGVKKLAIGYNFF